METKPFLTAEWRQLLMLNYEVDAALVAPYVPRGLEIDFWHERTYISLVGFLFLNTWILGFAVPFHSAFEEVNLRFYVRRGDRRGVVFIREIVPRRAVVWLANTVYGENYVRLPMRHSSPDGGYEYAWRYNGRWNSLVATQLGATSLLTPGSHEEFIAEHYWGYARRLQEATVEYRVEHPQWRVRSCGMARIEGAVADVYPREFGFLNERAPDTAFVTDGSTVTVFAGQELRS